MTLVFKDAVQITGFVFVMMLFIEYANVLTSGTWQQRFTEHHWGQYLLAAFLGATPGCLGAFAVVAMYSHRFLSLGAVVAAMVATAGDESFVMFALIPKQALVIHGLLFILGMIAGGLTDMILGRRMTALPCAEGFVIHPDAKEVVLPWRRVVGQWKQCIASRGAISTFLFLYIVALLTGQIGPAQWNWIKTTMLLVSGGALFIVCTVPDHFLEEHLWRHIALKHAPRIFAWTLGALIAIHLLSGHLLALQAVQESPWIILLIACLVGLIPESGPHLVFVTLYANGTIPGSVLFASSIVQDGHGMLPMLAHSRRDFILIKGINFIIGMLCGAAGIAMGY
ncbi:MAG: putative manganese transporter [Fibrobacterota bacterium]